MSSLQEKQPILCNGIDPSPDWNSEDLEALSKLESEVVSLLSHCLKWSRKVAIVSYRPHDYVVRRCRVYMRAVHYLIEVNGIEIISTENVKNGSSPVSWKRDIFRSIIKENRLPMVPSKFMYVGFGENDRAAAWSLQDQDIPKNRMRVRLLPETTSIAELANVVEELNSTYADNMRSRFAVGDWRAPRTQE